LHWALRPRAGLPHVTQKGSLVAPDRPSGSTTSHNAQLTEEDERLKVEELVNARIRRNAATDTGVLPIAEAQQAGRHSPSSAEKYSDTVGS
jgi:alanyl-tRNA synthetase